MDWFYHAPGQGRVGPVSADDLRARYRDRRIERDTLVWRDGLREWQPLDRLADELGLHGVVPDHRLPPPLPATPPIAMSTAMPTARTAPPRRMHGCLVALLVGLVVSVPLVGILAAIALPAYRDYTVRAKVAGAIEPRASALRQGIEAARARFGQCPDEAAGAGIGDAGDGLRLGELDDGRCAFEITFGGIHPDVDGRTLLHVAPTGPGDAWDCTGGDLPPRYRPAACRGTAMDPSR